MFLSKLNISRCRLSYGNNCIGRQRSHCYYFCSDQGGVKEVCTLTAPITMYLVLLTIC